MKVYEVGWACGMCGGGTVTYRGLVGKLEGKRKLGRLKQRWEHNINRKLKEVG